VSTSLKPSFEILTARCFSSHSILSKGMYPPHSTPGEAGTLVTQFFICHLLPQTAPGIDGNVAFMCTSGKNVWGITCVNMYWTGNAFCSVITSCPEAIVCYAQYKDRNQRGEVMGREQRSRFQIMKGLQSMTRLNINQKAGHRRVSIREGKWS
jgi:hypothetical protein